MPPEYPKGINQFTEDNAIKFVEFFLDVLEYSTNTGDLQPLDEYSLEECTSCNDWRDEVRKTYSDGGKFEGYSLIPTQQEYSELARNADTIVFSLELEISDYSTFDSTGSLVEKYPRTIKARDFALTFFEGTWGVFDFGRFGEVK